MKWNHPAGSPSATLILTHSAGVPMDSPFMKRIAELLAAQSITVVRFEFPYMAQRCKDGRRRSPNPQAQSLDYWWRAHAQVREILDGSSALGGKSMGGRMASLLADELGVGALVCLGYPLYAASKSEKPRVAHLAGLRTPIPIVQGERDALGSREAVVGYALTPTIRLHWLATTDYDLKPLKASGLTHERHLAVTAREAAGFLRGLQDH